MNYYTIAPSLNLAPYVRFFWVLEGNFIQDTYVYRSLADSCTELLFHYKGVFKDLESSSEFSPLSLIHAQSRKYRRFETTEEFGIFGAYLYPFALPILLNIPASDLSNEMLSLESVLGSGGRELEERILGAHDNRLRVMILSTFLEGLLSNDSKHDKNIQNAILYSIQSNGQTSVKQLASQFCLSERQFERKFKSYSGFNPKMYLRIIRFHNAIEEYTYHSKTLSEVSHLCGYYDQSHFSHDFKEFSGYHPSHYFSPERSDRSIINEQDVGNLQLFS